ncbi:MAG TPA: hypothetical protein VII75_00575 [Thermoanaerobaculia bacterium]
MTVLKRLSTAVTYFRQFAPRFRVFVTNAAKTGSSGTRSERRRHSLNRFIVDISAVAF